MGEIKKCSYCQGPIDIERDRYVRPDKIKWAHFDCYENFLSLGKATLPEKKKEVVCFYCKEKFILEDENYRMPRINRYAHRECYDKYYEDDEQYVDYMYSVLTRNGVKYNYHKCEGQRIKFLKEGYTNKGIALSLQYFYEIQKGDSSKSYGGIGIVPYIYEDAFLYYQKEEAERRRLQTLLRHQQEEKREEIVVAAPKKVNKKKNKEFSLEDI